MTGGLQVIENNLFVNGERIPGDPDINFYGGGTETVFRIPKIGSYYFSLGLGGLVEYLKEMSEFAEDHVNGINYGTYGLIRLSKDKIRQELRIKK